jgi:hypothetical protein
MTARKPKIKYSTDLDIVAHNLTLLGLTNEELGKTFGVSARTIYNWAKGSETFNDAIHSGKDVADSKVVKVLYKKALAGSVPAIIYWLNNRQNLKWQSAPKIAPIEVEAQVKSIKVTIQPRVEVPILDDEPDA